jgi:hypothetical protein
MAEELVVKEQLTPGLIETGYELTGLLRRDLDFALVCSLWLYTAASNRWRLDLSSPLVDSYGPLHAYRIIQERLRAFDAANGSLPLDSISVLSPDHVIVRSLQTLGHFEIMDVPSARGNPVVSPRRISLRRVGDVFVDDAYVYFIR